MKRSILHKASKAGFAVLLLVVVRIHPAEAQSPPDTAKLQAKLTAGKASFLLGENIALDYCLLNASSKSVLATAGFSTFRVTATDARGIEQPQPKPMGTGDELFSPVIVESGKSWCHSIALQECLDIQDPGAYDVRMVFQSANNSPFVLTEDRKSVTFDPRGLMQCADCAALPTLPIPTKEAVADSIAPGPVEAHTTVMLVMPTEGQAPNLIGEMERLQSGPVGPDFPTIRYAVYLAPLLKRAEAGNISAKRKWSMAVSNIGLSLRYVESRSAGGRSS